MRIYRDAQTEAELSTAPMVYQSRVRAVILPPGVGSFSRTLPRLVEAGRQLLMGRAWAGGGRWVTKVEVCFSTVSALVPLDLASSPALYANLSEESQGVGWHAWGMDRSITGLVTTMG
jgi:hypothetical protein